MLNTYIAYENLKRVKEKEHNTTIKLSGEDLGLGIAYYLESTWYSQHKNANNIELENETRGSFIYRPREIDRHILLANFSQKTYKNPLTDGIKKDRTEIVLASVDWAFPYKSRYKFLAQIAGKKALDRVETKAGDINEYKGSIYLGQLGLEYKFAKDFTLETYTRRLWDSYGNEHLGAGAELTYYLSDNIGLGLGYSNLSTDDPDLRKFVDWSEGTYLVIRAKF